jgi:biopolymer transport protein TolR
MGVKSRIVQKEVMELNLIPFMNLLSVLLVFLLATSAYVQLSVLDISLPPTAGPGSKKQEEKPQKKDEDITLTVLISDQAFTVGARGGFLPSILKQGGKYDYEKLGEQLKKVKGQFPSREEIIITAEPNIIYDIIVGVMDKCRENGFPNVSIGAIQ